MKNVLLRENLPLLHRFAQGAVLLAFDFDGTLAPIVDHPPDAVMRAKTRALLTQLAQLYPCVVISGRARADTMEKVKGVPMRAVIGNHGLEPSRGLPGARLLVKQWQEQLACLLPATAGVIIENKGPTLAIHYRLARAHPVVRQRVLTAVSRCRGARVVEGKMVVNLLPAQAAHKGTALVHLCKRLRCKSAIFLGDDDTDEDVFALPHQGRVLGIRVGRSKRSQADYFVASQKHVDRLLTELIAARR